MFLIICSELIARDQEDRCSYLCTEKKEDLIKEWHDIEKRASIFQKLKDVKEQYVNKNLVGNVLLIIKEDGKL